MPLPQPRGPVAARVCGYRSGDGRYLLDRHALLDPTRTAALAGRLNGVPGEELTAAERSACAPGERPAALVFRYTAGDSALVEVWGGSCGLVATSARAERGRGDIVKAVVEALAVAGRPINFGHRVGVR
jgi:hypothetical protein